MKFVRPLALAAASVLPAELVLAELFGHHRQQQHIEGIPTIPVGSFTPTSNVANATAISVSVGSGNSTGGLVLPESGRYLYISVAG